MDARSVLKAKSLPLPALREGEEILIQTEISNAIFWKGIAVLIIAILFLLVAYQLAIFLSLVAVLMLINEYIVKHFLLVVVTSQRVFMRRGFLLSDMMQFQYNRIESIETQTTIIGQLFGYSTLMIGGTGTRLGIIPFVANAMDVQTVVNEILQRKDVSSSEYLERQARMQADAIAEALDN